MNEYQLSEMSIVVLHEFEIAGAHSQGFSYPHSHMEKYIFLDYLLNAAAIGGYLTLGYVPSV